ncbi:MAG TPA: hypothetical protein VNT03_16260, partial [Baekduia sp.]|nr:hypothetical protein [Baekduia sp.]
LVPPGDAGALARALERAAGDRDLRERLSAAGRRKAQEFAPEAIAGQMLDLYRQVASANGAARKMRQP